MTRELPLTTRALAAVGIALATGVVGYLTLVAPKAHEVAQLESQLHLGAGPAVTAPAAAIGETERQLWRELEARLRARFVEPSDQLRALDEVGRLASDAGLSLTSVAIQNPQVLRPLTTPGSLAVNPGSIRLTARHRYAELVDFLEAVRHGRTYVVLESLDVRRVDDHLESEIRLISLQWK
jgi:Tfp pilus assembly protein PilO